MALLRVRASDTFFFFLFYVAIELSVIASLLQTEFTCNTGVCIDLERHCDGSYDCEDEHISDEVCQLILPLPSSYRAEKPPANNTPVNLTVTLERVHSVDIAVGTFSVALKVRYCTSPSCYSLTVKSTIPACYYCFTADSPPSCYSSTVDSNLLLVWTAKKAYSTYQTLRKMLKTCIILLLNITPFLAVL